MNGLADAQVGAAAAQIAAHGFVDFRIGWLGVFGEERGGRHDLARLAVATLRNIQFHPGLLQSMRGVGREAFDGGDVSINGSPERRHAGALWLSIDVNGTSAALANPATVFGAVKVENIAQHPQQGGVGGGVDGGGPSVNREICRHSLKPGRT